MEDFSAHDPSRHLDAKELQQLPRPSGPERIANSPSTTSQLRAVPRRVRQPLSPVGKTMKGAKISRRSLLFGRLFSTPRPGIDLVARGPAVMSYDSPSRRSRPEPSPSAFSPPNHPKLVVTLNANTCLPFCSVCVEQCPVPGALVMAAGRVSVNASKCTGCGDCVPLCPSPMPSLRMKVDTG